MTLRPAPGPAPARIPSFTAHPLVPPLAHLPAHLPGRAREDRPGTSSELCRLFLPVSSGLGCEKSRDSSRRPKGRITLERLTPAGAPTENAYPAEPRTRAQARSSHSAVGLFEGKRAEDDRACAGSPCELRVRASHRPASCLVTTTDGSRFQFCPGSSAPSTSSSRKAVPMCSAQNPGRDRRRRPPVHRPRRSPTCRPGSRFGGRPVRLQRPVAPSRLASPRPGLLPGSAVAFPGHTLRPALSLPAPFATGAGRAVPAPLLSALSPLEAPDSSSREQRFPLCPEMPCGRKPVSLCGFP